VASSVAFSPRSATVGSGVQVTVTLDNRDAGVFHDWTLYNPAGGVLAATETVSGPATNSVTFTAPAPGTYLFNCTVHPREMNGSVNVQ
jgi:plastocyanin